MRLQHLSTLLPLTQLCGGLGPTSSAVLIRLMVASHPGAPWSWNLV